MIEKLNNKLGQLNTEFENNTLDKGGAEILNKVTTIVNYLGKNFSTLNGGELSQIQIKLAGYKYFLIEYTTELQRMSEFYNLEIKEYTAKEWKNTMKKIVEEEGKVSNVGQIENRIKIEIEGLYQLQILYSNYYSKYRLKISTIDDLVTAITQRIASKKRELENINHG